jgi:lipoprotein NlpI
MRVILAVLILAFSCLRADDKADNLIQKALSALKRHEPAVALESAEAALKIDPKQAKAWFARGLANDALGKFEEALQDFNRVLELDPNLPEALNERGSVQFKLGRIEESVKDFDRYLELQPKEFPGHWKRGISLYYAGRYDDGRKQFEGYEKVDTNDVENAVWHFLCVARKDGVEKARAGILKIGRDRRVPMMEVYDLFAGKLKPDDVLAAVMRGDPDAKELNQRRFYAHLYLGLYCEANGDTKGALEHLSTAEKHKIGHYMWNVAQVHAERLKKNAKPK